MSKKAVIVSAARTAVGSFGGSLVGFPVHEMGGVVINEALKRANVNPASVDEVILGNVFYPPIITCLGREAAIRAGIPIEVPGFTVERQCGSSLQAINLAALMISGNQADIVVAGGVENMSDYPYALYNARWKGIGYKDTKLVDVAADTLRDDKGITSGMSAEYLAEKYNISREEQDEFAFESQMKAKAAIAAGKFKDEIVPLEIKSRKGTRIFDVDEHPRTDITMELLSKLQPAFKKGGTVTPGNSCGMNDGASAVVVMSEEKAKELGIKPLVTIEAFAAGGVEPKLFGEGPIVAVSKVLKRAGMDVNQLDVIESNEAFAAQQIACERVLKWDMTRINPNGGAIALGHPLGNSGSRLTTTLIYEMERRQSTYGLATLCTGGGMGVALIVKREA